MKLIGTVALLAVVQQGSCTATAPAVDAADVRFEVEYSNFAWTPVWKGFVIDGEGAITRFDLGQTAWEAGGEEYIDAARLEAKWATRAQPYGTVDEEVMERMRVRVPAAADGRLSGPLSRCADAGTIAYTAYRYDRTRDAWQRIVLRREGDVAQLNEAAAARALADWLREFEFFHTPEGCQP